MPSLTTSRYWLPRVWNHFFLLPKKMKRMSTLSGDPLQSRKWRVSRWTAPWPDGQTRTTSLTKSPPAACDPPRCRMQDLANKDPLLWIRIFCNWGSWNPSAWMGGFFRCCPEQNCGIFRCLRRGKGFGAFVYQVSCRRPSCTRSRLLLPVTRARMQK